MASPLAAVGKERSDLASLPSNVMRTMPYTTYIAVGSYAIIAGSEDAAWLELCLLMNEILNAVFKFIPARIVGKQASLLRRPAGAADSGIYPQHHPKVSSTSGMPSGHAQTSGLLGTILTCYVLDLRAAREPETVSMIDVRVHATASAHTVCAIAYVWILAAAVMLSRTRFGGPLRVSVGGRSIAQHTCLQVAVGAIIGVCLGFTAYWCHLRRSGWWLGLVAACTVLALATAGAYLAESLSERGLKRTSRESGGHSDSTADSSSPGNGSSPGASAESASETRNGESLVGSGVADRPAAYELVKTTDPAVMGDRKSVV